MILVRLFLNTVKNPSTGQFTARLLTAFLFVWVLVAAWLGEQFFHFAVPQYMFFTFGTLVLGCLGLDMVGYRTATASMPSPSPQPIPDEPQSPLIAPIAEAVAGNGNGHHSPESLGV